ncbi:MULTISPECIES: hypothetical protein [Clostridium]|uniref:Uncharacterized protein n=1 Tax=Clostridium carnis TaxID=1530 RepID=A0ABY6SS99_9CLOT|nr:hypothetical protein [Clostridium carnis]CAI3560821.1 conserved hypothetical protein [Clostridium neonatale]CAI3562168.1 conserved hypothetical protein [Clostridium neonatale]CAI3583104.1 conserved hypothetical protein [Clostridium neonatale]CAI3622869.1 conserved hypothetical protein [Clostridium neonatale]CAI3675238.1 conserved hypothetical protein [Clostridium neonatale]
MNEKSTRTIEKEISFENSGEKIIMTVEIVNVNKNTKIKDFLETMFKEIKDSLF